MTLFISASTFAQENSRLDFEAELRALENNQIKTEELQMRNADAVTDVVSDEVATGLAAPVRKDLLDTEVKPQEKTTSQQERTRRVRSR